MKDILIDVLAAKRLTRAIVKDEITEPVRAHKFFHKHSKLSYLVNCEICMSVYTSAAVVVSSIVFPSASKPIKYFLALAEAQALFAEQESRLEATSQGF